MSLQNKLFIIVFYIALQLVSQDPTAPKQTVQQLLQLALLLWWVRKLSPYRCERVLLSIRNRYYFGRAVIACTDTPGFPLTSAIVF
ncbi:uncharacterized protein TrAtP1_003946 [Trichoderma atroviride]|uniref:uncharacterized protein n=1 Tax=Hypocrea atroviridis TaxID=63577 RepID=UPI003317492C|nr:hypothetical protein TrAtP1_003946 [Trichoderma atroviride]